MEKKNISLYFYFLEIRFRLFYLLISFFITFLVAYFYAFDLIFIFVQPFLLPKNFIFTDLTEALYTNLKICLIFTIHTVLPFTFYQLWSFIIPGFFKKERKKITFITFFLFFLFVIEGGLVFSVVLPEIYNFLCTFEIKKALLTIQLEARIFSYVNFTLKFYFYIMFFFQSPLLFIFLFKSKLLTASSLVFFRKYFYFISLLLAAFLTPPDIFYQLIIAFLFISVYEVSIWFGFFYENNP